MNTPDSCFDYIKFTVLNNCSINHDDFRFTARCSMKDCMDLVRDFIETYPSNEYSISSIGGRGRWLKAKSYNELNSQQRANFNAIVKMYNELAS